MADGKTFTDEEIAEIMKLVDATRRTQYVGARYVPIFGRRGEASIEWDGTAPYEPLTIVLHQGNSYTSRRHVPAGVDITDGRYWAETGNYNAQVEQYRQDVLRYDTRITAAQTGADAAQADADAANGKLAAMGVDTTTDGTDMLHRIETMETSVATHTGMAAAFGINSVQDATTAKTEIDARNEETASKIQDNTDTFNSRMSALGVGTDEKASKTKIQIDKMAHNGIMVVLGDSIAEGFSASPRLEKRFTTLTAASLGMVEKNYAVAASFFATSYDADGNTIQNQAKRAINDTTYNHEDVSLIIIEGGINNGRDNAKNSANGILSIIEHMRPSFANANIVVMFNLNGGGYHEALAGEVCHSAKINLQTILESGAADGVMDCTSWLVGAPQYVDNTNLADIIHPNTAGHAYIAGKLISILKTGINPKDSISAPDYGNKYLPLEWSDAMRDYWDESKTVSTIRLLVNDSSISLKGELIVHIKSDISQQLVGYLNSGIVFQRIIKLPLTIGTSFCTANGFAEIDHYTTEESGGRALLMAEKWLVQKSNNEYYLTLKHQNLNPAKKIGAGGIIVFPIDYTIPMPSM